MNDYGLGIEELDVDEEEIEDADGLGGLDDDLDSFGELDGVDELDGFGEGSLIDMEEDFEDEDEFGFDDADELFDLDDEFDEFSFKKLRKKIKNTAKKLVKVAKQVALPALKTVLGGGALGPIGGILGGLLGGKGKGRRLSIMALIRKLLGGLGEEAEFYDGDTDADSYGEDELEFEGDEMDDEGQSEEDAQAEALADMIATNSNPTEEDVDEFLGALLGIASKILPGIGKSLIKGAGKLVKRLVSKRRTRGLVSTIPTIVRRAAKTLARDRKRGRRITGGLVRRRLAGHTLGVLTHPRQCGRAITRSSLWRQRYFRLLRGRQGRRIRQARIRRARMLRLRY